MSVADSVPNKTVDTFIVNFASVATGASFTGVILTVTVAILDCAAPSLTRYVKVSVPFAFGAGAKVKSGFVAILIEAVPLAPFVTIEYTSLLPSGSDAVNLPENAVSSGVVN